MAVIALVTDFGTRDPYVAAMKGVIAARCDARVFDLTHEIEPFDAFEAAWFLRAVVAYWPVGTIFVTVIDPGVGTSRRILAVEWEGRVFLAPDNGVLTFIDGEAVSVENDRFFLPDGSTTFHGRDRFAPVAAALANGTPLSDLGPPAHDIVRFGYEEPSYGCASVAGTIVHIDRFGNAVTDVVASRVPMPRFALRTGEHTISRIGTTYEGEGPLIIIGSSGTIEISVPRASAAALLHLRRGDRVTIIPT